MRIQGHDAARWLDAERLIAYPRFVFAAFAVLGAAWLVMGGGMTAPGGNLLGREFLSLWAASSVALQGIPAAAYDATQHQAVQMAVAAAGADGPAGWFYPPVLFLLVLPLAYLPYLGALAAWLTVTYGVYVFMARRLGREQAVLWPLIAFPAVYVNMGAGQGGLLVAALLGGALLLADRRPVLAGLMAGMLIFKPLVAVLLPLVFLAGGRWRALAATVLSAGALAGLSLQFFGIETWQAFLAAAPAAGWTFESSGIDWQRMQSLFAIVRLLGGSADTAIAVHGTIGLAAVVSAMWIWRQPVNVEIRGSAVVCAMLLANPYVRDYDLILLALPIGLLLVQGRRDGFHAWEGPTLVAVWWLPAAALVTAPVLGVPVAPALIVLMLALVLRRVSETAMDGRVAEPAPHILAEAGAQ